MSSTYSSGKIDIFRNRLDANMIVAVTIQKKLSGLVSVQENEGQKRLLNKKFTRKVSTASHFTETRSFSMFFSVEPSPYQVKAFLKVYDGQNLSKSNLLKAMLSIRTSH